MAGQLLDRVAWTRIMLPPQGGGASGGWKHTKSSSAVGDARLLDWVDIAPSGDIKGSACFERAGSRKGLGDRGRPDGMGSSKGDVGAGDESVLPK